MLTPSGDYLSGRVTLTNITKTLTAATLRFNNLECEDEKDYMCIAHYVNEFGIISVESEPTRILPFLQCLTVFLVKLLHQKKKKQENSFANFPNNRNNIAVSTNRNSRSSLLTDTDNLMPLLTTVKSVSNFREGDTVQFTCTGNIGKPPGRFVWQIIPQQGKPIFYSNVTTVVVDQIQDICSFTGTSNLTVEITAHHFKAKSQCFEESQADVKGMFVETEPLDVYCKHKHTFSI
ncbi:unnamed protein product [Mytilus edulis]|uniref:Ig-like domain-containing protein n=1 Tax=Mytilus edulis TaxID=6550 RepID=A0A8S3V1D2_MYTED|nr:unnamed protein product [Mytilus edulis]